MNSVIEFNKNLKDYNTLKLKSVTSHYIKIKDIKVIQFALNYAKENKLNVLVLSGGSNIVLPKEIQALVIHIDIKGIDILYEDLDFVTVKVASGEIWNDFVCYTTEKGWYGLQNLVLIPGLVGASPIQNIGAYDVSVGEFIETVSVYDSNTLTFYELKSDECRFAYRHSIFKDEPYRYIITHVTFKLLKKAQLKLTYSDIKRCSNNGDISALELQNIIINLRQSKLPDPLLYPNVGSFFKNPIISQIHFRQLQNEFPKMVHFLLEDGNVKVSAGWLIENADWKGKRIGDVGMSHIHSLVLVNYGDETSSNDIHITFELVQLDVKSKFSIQLMREPVIFNSKGLIVIE